MKELELIPHAKNLMESTRSVGYSLPAAVADLIDNSIAADARRVRIWTPTESERDLRILDDGRGMDEEGLLAAMRYGSRFVGLERESGDLGRFGLGLKMASLSQCRCLTVVSKQGDRVVGACWDLDHVGAASCEWAVQLLEAQDLEKVPWIEELRGQSSGTLVVWTKLDNMLMGISERGFSDALMQRLSDLKSHLALVFHRYLQGEGPHSFEIEFNGRLIEPADPFLEGRSQRPFATDSFSSRTAVSSAVLATLLAMHSVPASAFTSDEWAKNAFDSQGEWYDFHVWANDENSYTGHKKESVEINIDSGTLTGDSQYNDIRGSVIGFVNMYAGDPRGTYRAPTS